MSPRWAALGTDAAVRRHNGQCGGDHPRRATSDRCFDTYATNNIPCQREQPVFCFSCWAAASMSNLLLLHEPFRATYSSTFPDPSVGFVMDWAPYHSVNFSKFWRLFKCGCKLSSTLRMRTSQQIVTNVYAMNDPFQQTRTSEACDVDPEPLSMSCRKTQTNKQTNKQTKYHKFTIYSTFTSKFRSSTVHRKLKGPLRSFAKDHHSYLRALPDTVQDLRAQKKPSFTLPHDPAYGKSRGKDCHRPDSQPCGQVPCALMPTLLLTRNCSRVHGNTTRDCAQCADLDFQVEGGQWKAVGRAGGREGRGGR